MEKNTTYEYAHIEMSDSYDKYWIGIINSYISAGTIPNKTLEAIYDSCALKSQKQFADLMNTQGAGTCDS